MANHTINAKDSSQEVFRKTRSLYALKHKLKRQWKRLIKTSISLAKESGIDTYEISQYDQAIHTYDRVNVVKDGEKIKDSELLGLSADTLPSLYRRYQQGVTRYNSELGNLEKMTSDVHI